MNNKVDGKDNMIRLTAVALVWAMIFSALYFPNRSAEAASNPASSLSINKRAVPNVDVNLTATVTRQPNSEQQQALNQFKASFGNKASARWNNFSGSPDIIMGFHTAPSGDTPENVARAFVNNNAALFGVDASSLVLSDQKEGMAAFLAKRKPAFRHG